MWTDLFKIVGLGLLGGQIGLGSPVFAQAKSAGPHEEFLCIADDVSKVYAGCEGRARTACFFDLREGKRCEIVAGSCRAWTYRRCQAWNESISRTTHGATHRTVNLSEYQKERNTVAFSKTQESFSRITVHYQGEGPAPEVLAGFLTDMLYEATRAERIRIFSSGCGTFADLGHSQRSLEKALSGLPLSVVRRLRTQEVTVSGNQFAALASNEITSVESRTQRSQSQATFRLTADVDGRAVTAKLASTYSCRSHGGESVQNLSRWCDVSDAQAKTVASCSDSHGKLQYEQCRPLTLRFAEKERVQTKTIYAVVSKKNVEYALPVADSSGRRLKLVYSEAVQWCRNRGMVLPSYSDVAAVIEFYDLIHEFSSRTGAIEGEVWTATPSPADSQLRYVYHLASHLTPNGQVWGSKAVDGEAYFICVR